MHGSAAALLFFFCFLDLQSAVNRGRMMDTVKKERVACIGVFQGVLASGNRADASR